MSDLYDKIILNLQIVGSIQEGQTLSTGTMTIVDHDSLSTAFWRSLTGENRQHVITTIRNILIQAMSYLERHYLDELYNKIKEAIDGVRNLALTYDKRNDKLTSAKFTLIADSNLKQLNTIYDRNPHSSADEASDDDDDVADDEASDDASLDEPLDKSINIPLENNISLEDNIPLEDNISLEDDKRVIITSDSETDYDEDIELVPVNNINLNMQNSDAQKNTPQSSLQKEEIFLMEEKEMGSSEEENETDQSVLKEDDEDVDASLDDTYDVYVKGSQKNSKSAPKYVPNAPYCESFLTYRGKSTGKYDYNGRLESFPTELNNDLNDDIIDNRIPRIAQPEMHYFSLDKTDITHDKTLKKQNWLKRFLSRFEEKTRLVQCDYDDNIYL